MLSIIIPTHHRCDLLRRCLTTVLNHAPSTTEVIVVDDASSDRSAGRIGQEFAGVQIVRLDRQRGFAAAANAGIRASRGKIIELLNDDTEVQPGWAEAALARFADPNIGSVAPLVLTWPKGDTIDSAGDCYYLGGFAQKRGHRQPLTAEFLQARPVFGVSAAAGFYRRAALEQVGLFPESFGSYFEDVDLACRLQRAGWQAMFEPASRVLHHISASHGGTSRRLLEQQSRNEERVFWRNIPAKDLWRTMPMHAAILFGKAWRRWQEGRLTPWLFGRLRALKEAPGLRRHRRPFHATMPGDTPKMA